VVVTDLGVYRFADSGEMTLASLHPGVTLERARAETGWTLAAPDAPPTTAAPTVEELRLLREVLDPGGAYLR
jgi:acyl CoA:acetate/3-ketoacid CoA transferase beta subunit